MKKEILVFIFIMLLSSIVISQKKDTVSVSGVNEEDIKGGNVVKIKDNFEVTVPKGQKIIIKGMEFIGVSSIKFTKNGIILDDHIFRFKQGSKVRLTFTEIDGLKELKYAEFTPDSDKEFRFNYKKKRFLIKLKSGKLFKFDGIKKEFESNGATIGNKDYEGGFKAYLNDKGEIVKTEFDKGSILRIISKSKNFGNLEFSSKKGFVLGKDGNVQILELADDLFEINLKGNIKLKRGDEFEYEGNSKGSIQSSKTGNIVNLEGGKGRILNGIWEIFYNKEKKQIKTKRAVTFKVLTKYDLSLSLNNGEKENIIINKIGELCIGKEDEKCRVSVMNRFEGTKAISLINKALKEDKLDEVEKLLKEKDFLIKEEERKELEKKLSSRKEYLTKRIKIKIEGNLPFKQQEKDLKKVIEIIDKNFLHYHPTISLGPIKYSAGRMVGDSLILINNKWYSRPAFVTSHELGHNMELLGNDIFGKDHYMKVNELCRKMVDLGVTFKYGARSELYGAFPYAYQDNQECYAEGFRSYITSLVKNEDLNFRIAPQGMFTLSTVKWLDPKHKKEVQKLKQDFIGLFGMTSVKNLGNLLEEGKITPLDDAISGRLGDVLNKDSLKKQSERGWNYPNSINMVFAPTKNSRIYLDDEGKLQVKGEWKTCSKTFPSQDKIYFINNNCRKVSDTKNSLVSRNEILKCTLTKDRFELEGKNILKEFDSLDTSTLKFNNAYRRILESKYSGLPKIPNQALNSLYGEVKYTTKKRRDKILKNKNLEKFIPYMDLLIRYDANINSLLDEGGALSKC
tara:strand:- start:5225 stop:7606 length:2382 start_codon:yes stop_codon:yes gene_type:complete